MKNPVKVFLGILLVLVLMQGVLATETYTFVTKWGTYGPDDGQFSIPNGIAVDPSGNIIVTDGREAGGTVSNYRVQKFNPNGTFLAKWGSYGSGDGQFTDPQGIAVDQSGNVYVTDRGNSRIQKFNPNGTLLAKWGSSGSGDGQFSCLSDVAVDSVGNVYVTDTCNERVEEFNSTGTFIAKWGSNGTKDGLFIATTGVAVNSLGNVYVVDSENKRVQKFSSDGTFITKWGSYGHGDGQFNIPGGIAVDSVGNVYVVDIYGNRVQKFSPDGTFITKWGSYGTEDAQFSGPRGIAVDSVGNVYVADSENRRVQKFAPGQSLLAVSSITPSTAKNTGAVGITALSGAGFAAGATVVFTKTGSPDISGTGVTVVSPTTITCRFDLNGKEAGVWNVVVTNTDGLSATLQGGFSVTDAPNPPLDSYDETPGLIGHSMCSNPLQVSFSESKNVRPHSPDVYKNRVVFVEKENIYLLDLPAGTIQELTVDGGNSAPAIGDSGIVWVHSNAGTILAPQPATSQVYYYNTTTGETQKITTGDANRSQPAISGTKIVWTDSRNGNKDIYLYDTITRNETQVTTNPEDQDAPAIFDNQVVWRDGRDGPDKTMYLYNLKTREFSRISSTAHEEAGEPEIAGTKVAWAGNRSTVCLYDITTKSESSMQADIFGDGGVSVSRNQLVWHDPLWRSPLPVCPPMMYCPVETCCPPEYQAIIMHSFSDTIQEEVYLRRVYAGIPGGPRVVNIDLRPKVSDTLLTWVDDKISVCSLSNQNILSINLRKIPYSSQPLVESQKPNQTHMGTLTQRPATPLPSYLTFIAIVVSIGTCSGIIRRKEKK